MLPLSTYYKALGLMKRVLRQPAETFECPVCGYAGLFHCMGAPTGARRHAMCPACGCLERHRAQWLTLQMLAKTCDLSRMRALHFAPERFFRLRFKRMFREYRTADLNPRRADLVIDLTQSPPAGLGPFDFVFASGVLEHIREDELALANIRKLLSPQGIAILPVPIIGPTTIEYPEPNPAELFHVRAPGLDYYERYRKYFAEVHVYSSRDFSEKYQTFVYEDRSRWPSSMPLRPTMAGERFEETVPVCRAGL